MEFNTVSVSDGVTMGTEGMKASLVSREVIADLIELVSRGHLFDGLVCLVGCDKTIPAAAMAVARLDLPAVILYNGTIYPGTYKGKPADVVTVYEAIGAYQAGKITLEELYEAENGACPGAGACGGQFTANTMATVLEFMGLSPSGLNGIPAEDPRKDEAARRAGELAMTLVRHDIRPSQIVTRASIDNAIASVAATGGSTNGVLHLLAIAAEFGIPLGIDEFGAIADRTPLIADMRPAVGTPPPTCSTPAVSPSSCASSSSAILTATRRRSTAGRSAASRPTSSRPPGSRSSDPSRRHSNRPAGWRSFTAPSPRGCAVKLAGHERRHHRGPARVFDSEHACFEAVREGQIESGDVVIRYEGQVGGPGMQEMLSVTGALVGPVLASPWRC